MVPGQWALAGVAATAKVAPAGGAAAGVVGVMRVQATDEDGVLLCRYMQARNGRYREWLGPAQPTAPPTAPSTEGLMCVQRHQIAWRVLRVMWVGSGPVGPTGEWVDGQALEAALRAAMPTWIDRS